MFTNTSVSRIVIIMKKRFTSYIIYGLLALFIFAAPRFFQLLTDWYWFVEIGFSNIFITILYSKILLGAGVGTLTFFVLYGNLWLTGRLVASKPIYIQLPVSTNLEIKGLEDERIETVKIKEINAEKYINKSTEIKSILS